MPNHYHEITSIDELREMLQREERIERCAFQDMDFTALAEEGYTARYYDCLFMGCTLTRPMRIQIDKSSLVFSHIDVPYNCFRNALYTAESLYDNYHVGHPESYHECFDYKVYAHYLDKGKVATDIKETLARTLHDHAMSDALQEMLSQYDERHIVGIMGGHGLLRTDPAYHLIASLSKRLTEEGYLMVSGGGPGAMEATHLGAWMAGRSAEELSQALAMLSPAPSFKDPLWLDTAFRVRQQFPSPRYVSLGVPTWLYGHEPATPFATHIAKYFENALREDGILTIAKGGIVYSPGSAGTMQEIFQDAVQNHYLSFGYASPMIFLGADYWMHEMPVYPLLQHLVDQGRYRNLMLSITDDELEVVDKIKSSFPDAPAPKQQKH